jgi:hypothetical protein
MPGRRPTSPEQVLETSMIDPSESDPNASASGGEVLYGEQARLAIANFRISDSAGQPLPTCRSAGRMWFESSTTVR